MFIAVAKARSLREAAEILGVTQPALSKQIRALESSLGIGLFLRHGRGMQLTPDGQALFLDVEPLMAALDFALAASLRKSRHGGALRIASVQTLVPAFIPTLARELLVVYPELHLSLHCDSSANVVESVERGRADVGFVYETAVDGPDLASEVIMEEALALYAREKRSIEMGELNALASLKLILPPRSYALRRMVERVLGTAVQPYIECDSLDLCLRLVASTEGVTILPATLPGDMIEDRGLQRLRLNVMPARNLVALSRTALARSPVFETALSIARRIGKHVL
ncbi:LysR family transcriptional regulator [Paraburkholderia caribensis]|uniref:LysR family transcriptional regulator n=1 Tax=Paraburkholderia caribensis TaxID=75105 RepID=UPI001F456183|nr:LysR family transcriptional regulator [Paraburkholderia caribensis]